MVKTTDIFVPFKKEHYLELNQNIYFAFSFHCSWWTVLLRESINYNFDWNFYPKCLFSTAQKLLMFLSLTFDYFEIDWLALKWNSRETFSIFFTQVVWSEEHKSSFAIDTKLMSYDWKNALKMFFRTEMKYQFLLLCTERLVWSKHKIYF